MTQIIVGVVLGACIATASFYARFLSVKGSVATFFLASVIFGVGGWQWTIPVLVFFVTSSVLSKVGKKRKREFDSVFEKSDVRDHGQVLANGGIGGMLAVAQASMPSTDFYPAYLGSIAAVTADTWGTEIGLLTKGKTISIVSVHPVPRGTSGGVSVTGFAGGVIGAVAIVVSAVPWIWDVRLATWIISAGIVASLIDSTLGATMQAEYTCAVCGSKTEREVHCSSPAKLVRGRKWITNDLVNWVCAMSGGMIMIILTLFFTS
ncbi:MAG: DUF92 domain-containing protein [Ignavibacteriales bacterium]|nr:DUF92 domain-containing protein [Ignavibacteriales bacterium]